jgi:hypothetical protein
VRFRKQLPACLLLVLLPSPVLACSCAAGSLGFCQALPDTSNLNHAVFIGKVTAFYPKSRTEVNQLVDEFVRTHRDLLEALRAQSPNTGGRRIAGTSSANVEWRRQMTEYIWGTMLTPAEREQLSKATDERELDRLGFDQRRQARMEVLENFVGADGSQFTLYTAVDGPACGFDFTEGGTYLMEAHRRPGSDTWQVTSCSRTRSVDRADEDLRVLRAWNTGQRLPGRISGQIIDRRNSATGKAFQVRLLGQTNSQRDFRRVWPVRV